MYKRVKTNYRCINVHVNEDGSQDRYCGSAEWRDGAWWCTHEHGWYHPDYAHEKCGAAVWDDGQIKMDMEVSQ